MNVWKYTYIKFYQFRRETLAGDYTAMLFVVELDFCVWMIRNHTLRKKGAFERIKKEVEEEPRKFLWGTLSLLFVLFTLAFVASSMYLWSQKMIPVLFAVKQL